MTDLKIMPTELSDVSIAFPADALDYMPAWEDIPDEFKKFDGPFQELARDWFMKGIGSTYTGFLMTEVDGVRLDGELVTRQLSAILGSYASKHEHKMASVAYLSSLWIDTCVYGPQGCGKDDLKVIGDFVLDIDEWIEHIDNGGETNG